MKSIILLAMLVIGMAACETPQPATGSDETTQSGATGVTRSDSTTTTTSTSTMTDTSGKGTGRDTSTTKRDSLPK